MEEHAVDVERPLDHRVHDALGHGDALLVAGVAVRRIAGGFIGVATAIRVLFSLAVVVVFARAMPTYTGRPITVVLACVAAMAFVALLVVTRELTRADAEALGKVAGAD